MRDITTRLVDGSLAKIRCFLRWAIQIGSIRLRNKIKAFFWLIRSRLMPMPIQKITRSLKAIPRDGADQFVPSESGYCQPRSSRKKQAATWTLTVNWYLSEV